MGSNNLARNREAEHMKNVDDKYKLLSDEEAYKSDSSGDLKGLTSNEVAKRIKEGKVN